METLYRATNSRYSGPSRNFEWWTPDRDWAATYGDQIVERACSDLRLIEVSLDAEEAQGELEAAGVDTDGIRFGLFREDYDLDTEIQQVLAHDKYGSVLSAAIRVAGFDGIIHPDHVEGQGIGTAVALTIA